MNNEKMVDINKEALKYNFSEVSKIWGNLDLLISKQIPYRKKITDDKLYFFQSGCQCHNTCLHDLWSELKKDFQFYRQTKLNLSHIPEEDDENKKCYYNDIKTLTQDTLNEIVTNTNREIEKILNSEAEKYKDTCSHHPEETVLALFKQHLAKLDQDKALSEEIRNTYDKTIDTRPKEEKSVKVRNEQDELIYTLEKSNGKLVIRAEPNITLKLTLAIDIEELEIHSPGKIILNIEGHEVKRLNVNADKLILNGTLASGHTTFNTNDFTSNGIFICSEALMLNSKTANFSRESILALRQGYQHEINAPATFKGKLYAAPFGYSKKTLSHDNAQKIIDNKELKAFLKKAIKEKIATSPRHTNSDSSPSLRASQNKLIISSKESIDFSGESYIQDMECHIESTEANVKVSGKHTSNRNMTFTAKERASVAPGTIIDLGDQVFELNGNNTIINDDTNLKNQNSAKKPIIRCGHTRINGHVTSSNANIEALYTARLRGKSSLYTCDTITAPKGIQLVSQNLYGLCYMTAKKIETHTYFNALSGIFCTDALTNAGVADFPLPCLVYPYSLAPELSLKNAGNIATELGTRLAPLILSFMFPGSALVKGLLLGFQVYIGYLIFGSYKQQLDDVCAKLANADEKETEFLNIQFNSLIAASISTILSSIGSFVFSGIALVKGANAQRSHLNLSSAINTSLGLISTNTSSSIFSLDLLGFNPGHRSYNIFGAHAFSPHLFQTNSNFVNKTPAWSYNAFSNESGIFNFGASKHLHSMDIWIDPDLTTCFAITSGACLSYAHFFHIGHDTVLFSGDQSQLRRFLLQHKDVKRIIIMSEERVNLPSYNNKKQDLEIIANGVSIIHKWLHLNNLTIHSRDEVLNDQSEIICERDANIYVDHKDFRANTGQKRHGPKQYQEAQACKKARTHNWLTKNSVNYMHQVQRVDNHHPVDFVVAKLIAGGNITIYARNAIFHGSYTAAGGSIIIDCYMDTTGDPAKHQWSKKKHHHNLLKFKWDVTKDTYTQLARTTFVAGGYIVINAHNIKMIGSILQGKLGIETHATNNTDLDPAESLRQHKRTSTSPISRHEQNSTDITNIPTVINSNGKTSMTCDNNLNSIGTDFLGDQGSLTLKGANKTSVLQAEDKHYYHESWSGFNFSIGGVNILGAHHKFGKLTKNAILNALTGRNSKQAAQNALATLLLSIGFSKNEVSIEQTTPSQGGVIYKLSFELGGQNAELDSSCRVKVQIFIDNAAYTTGHNHPYTTHITQKSKGASFALGIGANASYCDQRTEITSTVNPQWFFITALAVLNGDYDLAGFIFNCFGELTGNIGILATHTPVANKMSIKQKSHSGGISASGISAGRNSFQSDTKTAVGSGLYSEKDVTDALRIHNFTGSGSIGSKGKCKPDIDQQETTDANGGYSDVSQSSYSFSIAKNSIENRLLDRIVNSDPSKYIGTGYLGNVSKHNSRERHEFTVHGGVYSHQKTPSPAAEDKTTIKQDKHFSTPLINLVQLTEFLKELAQMLGQPGTELNNRGTDDPNFIDKLFDDNTKRFFENGGATNPAAPNNHNSQSHKKTEYTNSLHKYREEYFGSNKTGYVPRSLTTDNELKALAKYISRHDFTPLIKDYAEAVAKGAFEGVNDVLNTMLHPLTTLLFPLLRLTNNIAYATSPFSTPQARQAARNALLQIFIDLKQFNDDFDKMPGPQKLETAARILTNLLTVDWMSGKLAETISRYKNYRNPATLMKESPPFNKSQKVSSPSALVTDELAVKNEEITTKPGKHSLPFSLRKDNTFILGTNRYTVPRDLWAPFIEGKAPGVILHSRACLIGALKLRDFFKQFPSTIIAFALADLTEECPSFVEDVAQRFNIPPKSFRTLYELLNHSSELRPQEISKKSTAVNALFHYFDKHPQLLEALENEPPIFFLNKEQTAWAKQNLKPTHHINEDGRRAFIINPSVWKSILSSIKNCTPDELEERLNLIPTEIVNRIHDIELIEGLQKALNLRSDELNSKQLFLFFVTQRNTFPERPFYFDGKHLTITLNPAFYGEWATYDELFTIYPDKNLLNDVPGPAKDYYIKSCRFVCSDFKEWLSEKGFYNFSEEQLKPQKNSQDSEINKEYEIANNYQFEIENGKLQQDSGINKKDEIAASGYINIENGKLQSIISCSDSNPVKTSKEKNAIFFGLKQLGYKLNETRFEPHDTDFEEKLQSLDCISVNQVVNQNTIPANKPSYRRLWQTVFLLSQNHEVKDQSLPLGLLISDAFAAASQSLQQDDDISSLGIEIMTQTAHFLAEKFHQLYELHYKSWDVSLQYFLAKHISLLSTLTPNAIKEDLELLSGLLKTMLSKSHRIENFLRKNGLSEGLSNFSYYQNQAKTLKNIFAAYLKEVSFITRWHLTHQLNVLKNSEHHLKSPDTLPIAIKAWNNHLSKFSEMVDKTISIANRAYKGLMVLAIASNTYLIFSADDPVAAAPQQACLISTGAAGASLGLLLANTCGGYKPICMLTFPAIVAFITSEIMESPCAVGGQVTSAAISASNFQFFNKGNNVYGNENDPNSSASLIRATVN